MYGARVHMLNASCAIASGFYDHILTFLKLELDSLHVQRIKCRELSFASEWGEYTRFLDSTE